MKPILRASFLLSLSAFHFPLSAEEVPLIDGKDAVHMQYGPAICHSMVFTDPPDKNAARFEDATERAFLVDLPGPGVVCYDLDRLSVAAFWTTDKKRS